MLKLNQTYLDAVCSRLLKLKAAIAAYEAALRQDNGVVFADAEEGLRDAALSVGLYLEFYYALDDDTKERMRADIERKLKGGAA